MPDHKFDRDTDRQALLSDLKARIIDLTENRFSLPETGIYDEPVRYFKANLKWTPIIFGFLDWLEDVAGWQEAEDDSFPGIQSILIFEEGIEPLVTTQAELKAAICEGLTCWSEEMSKRVLSGKGLSFSVDGDGNIVVGGADGVEDIPDDPATQINESLAADAGGAIAVRRYLNQLFADLVALYGNGGSTQTPLAQAQKIISSKYAPGDPANIEAAVAEYYQNTLDTTQQIASLGTSDLDGWIFCRGYQTEKIVQYIWDKTTFIYPLKLNAVNLINNLDYDNLQNVFIDGHSVPSTDYFQYSCVKSEPYTFTQTWGTTTNDSHLFKKNHRYLIEIEGFVQDAAGDIQDVFWKRTSAGVLTFAPQSTQLGFATKVNPSQFEVEYRADHKYSWTIDMGNGGNANPQWNLAIDNTLINTAPITLNSVIRKVTDLGEII